jgi:serine phosphatase RsbU (regulator of sigma subunit)
MNHILKYFLTLIVFCFCSLFVLAQNKKIDSLLYVLKNVKEDTNKVFALNALSHNLFTLRSDTAMLIAQQAFQLAQKLDNKSGMCDAYNNISNCFSVKNDRDKQVEFLLRELKLREAIGDKMNVSRCFNDLGSVYRNIPNKGNVSINYFMKSITVLYELLEIAKHNIVPDEIKSIQKKIAVTFSIIGIKAWEDGMYSSAIKYQLNGLKIWEELGNKKGMANTYNNIGIVYDALGNYDKAIECHVLAIKTRELFLKDEKKNLKLNEISAIKNAEANSYNNLGVVYEKQGNLLLVSGDSLAAMKVYDKALEDLFRASQLFHETTNASGIPMTFDNLGNIFKDKGEYEKAMEYFLKALRFRDEKVCGDCKLDYSVSLISIGSLYYKQHKFKEAVEYLSKALKISDQLGAKENIKSCCEILSKIHFSLGDYKMAYEYLEKCSNVKDSLLNAESYKQVAEMNAKYETDKKETQIKLLEKDNEKQDIESKKQKIITFSVSIGLCLVLLLTLFILRGYQQKKKAHVIISQQKQEVENKNQLIEAKNKDITDSITYAERILRAMLPAESYVNSELGSIDAKYFILFKPKDIVSGDFYWFYKNDNALFYVTADSTGHGVPGGFMSMLGINLLNEIVIERNITDPGEILNKLRQEIIRSLKTDEGYSKDGMDMVICKILLIAPENNKRTLEYAAANNSFYVIRNGEILEQKAQKMPVGYMENASDFITNKFLLEKNDSIYTFTDGFADQFGGPKGKKFKYKQMEAFIRENVNEPMEVQKQKLDDNFQNWKGDLEQVDDVCLIAVRI